MERVLLVNAPNSCSDDIAGNYATFPAMGVVSLGTAIKQAYPNLDVSVVDGGIHKTEEIKQKIDSTKPDLLALSVLTPTYGEGLRVAEYAKQKFGSKVVFGNDHASFFPELILSRRPYVDYVIKGDVGEEPIVKLIGGELEEVPGLYWREGGRIRSNPERPYNLSTAEPATPDLELLGEDFKIYKKNYNENFERFHSKEKTPVTVNNVRGCANGTARCTYCSIYDLRLNEGKPENFWKTLEEYNKNYGVDFFFEVCDSFLSFNYPNRSGKSYVSELAATAPKGLKERGIELSIYARANDIVRQPDAIERLKQLNVTRVNMGLDSGDDKMLKLLRKNNLAGSSPSRINYEAAKKVAENGITLHMSFPLAPLGETNESLGHTVDLVKRIGEQFGSQIAVLEASPMVPLPNSPSWDMILSNENSRFNSGQRPLEMVKEAGIELSQKTKEMMREKYANQDLLDVEELTRDWITHFTHVRKADVDAAQEKVVRIAEKVHAKYGSAI